MRIPFLPLPVLFIGSLLLQASGLHAQETAIPHSAADSLIADTARVMEAYRAVDDDPSVGNTVPKFAVQLLDQPSRKLTDGSLRGKAYMIVFWSPSDRASMPYLVSLAESLEPWQGRGLTVIAVATKASASDVAALRSALPKTSWLISVPSPKHAEQMKKDFDVWRIPAAFLIDRYGRIAAAGQKLRPPWLDVTLEQVLK